MATTPSDPWNERSDEDVIEACIDGNAAAWETLVGRYNGLVYAVARRHGLVTDAAEDVLQEVFLALLHQLPNIKNRRGLPKWLITTSLRVSRRVVARQRTRVPDDASPDAVHAGPLDDVDAWERAARVREALRRLGGRCERLLTALYRGDRAGGYEAIGRDLDMPVGSIGPTPARCLERLAEILEELDPSENL